MNTISIEVVRVRLAAIWLIGVGLVLLVVVLQSLFGRFGDKVQDAWGWLLPTVMPTISMITGALGYSALDPVQSASVVRKPFFITAQWLSIMYLFLVALTVLAGPFAAADGKGMIELMHTSNLWLGPFQGVVASVFGILFMTKQAKKD